MKAAEGEYERLRQHPLLRKWQVGLLHGRLKNDEKVEVMRRFKERELHVLVATTVIEARRDVPNGDAHGGRERRALLAHAAAPGWRGRVGAASTVWCACSSGLGHHRARPRAPADHGDDRRRLRAGRGRTCACAARRGCGARQSGLPRLARRPVERPQSCSTRRRARRAGGEGGPAPAARGARAAAASLLSLYPRTARAALAG